MTDYFFFAGRCVSALPAALFAAFDAFPDRRTFDAAVPAFLPVTSFLFFDAIVSPYEQPLVLPQLRHL